MQAIWLHPTYLGVHLPAPFLSTEVTDEAISLSVLRNITILNTSFHAHQGHKICKVFSILTGKNFGTPVVPVLSLFKPSV